MKILFLCNDLEYFLAHRLNLVRAAQARGWSITICAGKYDDLLENPAFIGCDVIPADIERHRFSMFNDIKLIRQYVTLIAAIKPDIVQAITIKPNLYGSLAMAWMKMKRVRQLPKFVMLFAGLGKIFEPARGAGVSVRRMLVQSVFKFTGKIIHPQYIFENQHDMERMIKVGVAKRQSAIFVHGAGIDLSIYNLEQPVSKMPMILFASRMIGAKGILEFIEAAKIAARKFPDARFIAAGAIDESNPDVFDIAKLSKDELGPVEYVGNLAEADLVDILKQSAAVCLPSKLNEGFPRILLEAAFCSTAMITTDQPSVRSIVFPNETGWLLDRDGAQGLVEQISKAMIAALGNMEQTIVLGENANNIAVGMGLDAKRITEEIFQTYEN